MQHALNLCVVHLWAMLTDQLIEALLADEALADQVWNMWDAGLIPDEVGAIAWLLLAE